MFDLATEAPRRLPTLAASALLHGSLAALVVAASAWGIRDPPEPPEKILSWIKPMVTTPPIEARIVDAPKGNPNGGSPHAASAAPHRASPVQPVVIPESIPVAPSEPEPAGLEAAAPGPEDSLGIGPGTEPGPVGVRESGAGEEIRSADAPDVTPPVALVTTQPAYPHSAVSARIQGVVILEAIIGADGEVRSARVLRSAGVLLDQAAEKAILAWRYRPARVAGRPVAVYLTVTVKFGIS